MYVPLPLHVGAWADPGGGGVQGVRPPFLAHVVGFLTLGLKLDRSWTPFFLLVDLRWTPFSKIRSWGGWGAILELFKRIIDPTVKHHCP